MVQAIERYLKQAIVDRNHAVASAALMSSYVSQSHPLSGCPTCTCPASFLISTFATMGVVRWWSAGWTRSRRLCPQTASWCSTTPWDSSTTSARGTGWPCPRWSPNKWGRPFALRTDTAFWSALPARSWRTRREGLLECSMIFWRLAWDTRVRLE